MWATEELIVLSDLHLASASLEWAFTESAELAGLLDWVLEETPGPCHVVLAGDVFDCLLSEEPRRSSRSLEPLAARAFIASVLDSHPLLGAALRRLAASRDHDLIVLSGNHDPELILPLVQREIEERLGPSNAQPPVRWVVHGEGIRFDIGGVRVLVEHGDLFDPWNRVDHEGLRLAVARLQHGLEIDGSYRSPIGSSLFRDFVLPLGPRYPWISALKPEREAVFPLVHALLPPNQRPSFRNALKAAIPGLSRSFLGASVGRGRPAELRRAGPAIPDPRRALMDWLVEEERALARRGDEQRKLQQLVERLRKVSAEDTYFEMEAPDRNSRFIAELLERDLELVICGHTHAAKAHPLGGGLYLNTGTWQRLMKLPASSASQVEWEGFLDDLRDGMPVETWRRTFARVRANTGGAGASASLVEWRESRATALRSFSFECSSMRWEVIP